MGNSILKRIVLGGLLFGVIISNAQQDNKVSRYINPFIGTKVAGFIYCGNTFPGACAPFGMIQLSPETKIYADSVDYLPSGYNYNRNFISGFSHTHLSGIGAQDLYDLYIMPSCLSLDELSKRKDLSSPFSHQNEKASVGYYQVMLDEFGINVELTATTYTGMHRISYPKGKPHSLVLDLSKSEYKYNWHSKGVFDAQIKILDDRTLVGFRNLDGWQQYRKVCFYIQFSQPITHSIAHTYGNLYNDISVINGSDAKLFLLFKGSDEPLIIKVAISPVSMENAKLNMQENPEWDFDSVHQHTVDAWEKEFSNIRIEGSEEQKAIFYTGLYHAYIQPNIISDINGEYMRPNYDIGKVPIGEHEYSTFSLWDTYRAAHPLYTILQPKRTAEFVNSMLRYYDDYGLLPIWNMWGTDNYGMLGNHAIPVMVDAAMKHISGININKVYETIRKVSTTDHFKSPYSLLEKYGYIPDNLQNYSVSMTLDLCYDDACVARLAKELGKTEDYKFFHQRSLLYRNLYNKAWGFLSPKDSKGNWVKFNPLDYGETSIFPYCENNAWQYLFYVPHDIKGLSELMGGKQKFEERLDSLFNYNTPIDPNGPFGGFIGQYTHGNEPDHHNIYLYNFTNHPKKSAYYANKVMKEFYTNDPLGLVGNDDCGQTSAWYIFSSMGFYPVDAASGVYYIGSPQLDKVTIYLEGDKTFIIRTIRKSDKDIYVKSIKLNGKNYKKNYILHSDIINGGELVYTMTNH